MRFHLTIMRPEDQRAKFNVRCFHETVECLAYGLSMLGHDVSYRANVFIPEGAVNIVLGGQFADPRTPFPPATVFYNLEQIGGCHELQMIPQQLSETHRIWDYSAKNMAHWEWRKIEAQHVPIGFCPQLSRIVNATYPDIDVLFFGAISPRRKKILAQFAELPNINLHMAVGFGQERDALIARSKIVLNVHFFEAPQLWEQVRCSYLLSNRKCIVSEVSDDFPPALVGGVCEVPYDQLAQACADLIKDVDKRLEYQRRGYELFSKLREVDILRGALRHLSTASTAFAQVTKQ